MNPELWERVEAIFQEARALDEADRAAFLDRECADHPKWRSEVESLLAAGADAGTFLDTPVAPGVVHQALDDVTAAEPAEENSLAGTMLGPYRMLSPIGAGGIGTVWLAERADASYDTTVAIKVIKRGMDTDDLLNRFRTERQVLANLDHPNIARLIDGGAVPDGRPYLAMEYVDGRPIDVYCREQAMPIKDRLRLFCKVCDAVQHAHRNLVIHRDLKPGNVLISDSGEPKLLDFGIAKVLVPEGAEARDVTATGQRLLTPRYASPEQVRGESCTTATDVYSLGVILFELLTGRDPYGVDVRTPAALESAICDTEPSRPSTAVTDAGAVTDGDDTRRVARLLRGDIDNIVLMALRKDPQRRYASVDQFAGDVRRYLSGLPVLARADTFWYRSSKFVRRNPLGVGAMALVIGVLATSVVLVARQADLADRARIHAEEQADIARRTSGFLQNMLSSVNPDLAQGGDVTLLRQLLDDAEARVTAELADSPTVAAPVHYVIGTTYHALGLFEEAQRHLEAAVDLRRETDNESVLMRVESELALATTLEKRGDYDRAEHLVRAALEVQRVEIGAAAPEIGSTLNLLGVIVQSHDAEAGEQIFREALPLLAKGGDEFRDSHISCLQHLGTILSQTFRNEEASAHFAEAVALGRARYGPVSTQTAMLVHNYATFLRRQSEFEESRALYEEALQIKRTLYDEPHTSLAVTLNNYATLLELVKDWDAAEETYLEAIDIHIETLGRVHRDVGTALNNLAGLYRQTERYDEAEERYLEAVSIYEQALGVDHFWVTIALTNLAIVYERQGRYDDMEPIVRRSYDIQSVAQPDGSIWTARTETMLGVCLSMRGDFEEAETLLLKGYQFLEADVGDANSTTQRAIARLVVLYERWGRENEAKMWRLRSAGED